MESLAKISSLVESARDLTLDAAQAARNARGVTRLLDKTQIKKLLDSRNDRNIHEGLRQVISIMCRGQEAAHFFSSIVKNVASANLEIKKLVYLYLVRYAEEEPDMALLSINTIQRSLSDTNPHVRALALRTMTGIHVPVISQIVSLAIRRGAADMSPLVRRAAALAAPKCFRLDPAQLPALANVLASLLADRQHFVAGAAVASFVDICPDRLDLIHPVYRGLVRKIVDMDEWSQLASLRLLTYYARRCFPRRGGGTDVPLQDQPGRTTTESGKKNLANFYGDGQMLDPDLELFLNAIRPLLQSRSSAVVVAVARCLIDVGTAEHLAHAVGPLVALMRSAADVKQLALHNIVVVCLARPADFVPHVGHFFVRATDPVSVWELKLEVLALVFPHCPAQIRSLILHELEHCARASANTALVRDAVRAIGRCAQADRAAAARCLRLLLGQITSLDGTLAAESLTVIRHLIQLDPARHVSTVVRLARNLDSAVDPHARATIIWLVGEFSGLNMTSSSTSTCVSPINRVSPTNRVSPISRISPTSRISPITRVSASNSAADIAPDVLRILLRDFTSESEAAKLQIVLLAAKVYLNELNRPQPGIDDPGELSPWPATDRGSRARQLWEYVLQLVRYDVSYDLRDRARTFAALLAVPQLATLMLLAPKPPPHAPSPSEARRGLTLGSASLVLGGGSSSSRGSVSGDAGCAVAVRGYQPPPEWVEPGREPDSRLREDGAAPGLVAADQSSFAGAGKRTDAAPSGGLAAAVGVKSLADWLAEGKEEEESSEDGNEDRNGDGHEDDNAEESEEESAEESEEESEEAGDEDDEEEEEGEEGEEDGGRGLIMTDADVGEK